MPQSVTIKSPPQAFAVIKEIEDQGHEFGEDCRKAGWGALAQGLAAPMDRALDRHLEEADRRGEADRRNGSNQRWPSTELSWIELSVPRIRRCYAGAALRAQARHAPDVDRLILAIVPAGCHNGSERGSTRAPGRGFGVHFF